MMTTNEVAKVIDTVMSIPGMNEAVRIDVKVSRKNVLLLHQVIQKGLTVNEADNQSGLLAELPPETMSELQSLSEEFLQKAGLVELSEKLSSLSPIT